MVEWPGRCYRCREVILDWADAGLYGRRWVHKECFTHLWQQAMGKGEEVPPLQPPTERGAHLELPMLIFLLLFHFGGGAAVAGWIMVNQFDYAAGNWILAIGIITPLVGIAGIAVNIISRRRIELIRQALETQGGWQPGR
jgi:hypothetical protein